MCAVDFVAGILLFQWEARMLRSMLRVSPCSGNFCAALSLEDCTRNATACSHKAWNSSSKAALSKAALSKACLFSLHRCPYIETQDADSV